MDDYDDEGEEYEYYYPEEDMTDGSGMHAHNMGQAVYTQDGQ